MQDMPGYLVALFFFTPLVAGIIIYFYKTRHARLWRQGIFPPKLKFSQDNLLEAYLALGALLVLLDYGQTKGSKQYINQYFNRYFKKSNYNFGDSLIFSMRHPIKIDTVCDWLKIHLKEDREKAQVLYFLTGIAFLNGSLREKELTFLQLINTKLGLKTSNLERILAIYRSYYANKKDNEKQHKLFKQTDKRRYFAQILGIEENSDSQTIKKAYRKLAKQHHPDLFANASQAQQQMAKDKFQQIQEAYERLSK